MTSDLKQGDQVVIISPRVSRRGPWPVRRIEADGKIIWVDQRSKGGHIRQTVFEPEELVKIDPNMPQKEAVQLALRAHVPPNLRCKYCAEPGSEPTFVTDRLRNKERLCTAHRAEYTDEYRQEAEKNQIQEKVTAKLDAKYLKKQR